MLASYHNFLNNFFLHHHHSCKVHTVHICWEIKWHFTFLWELHFLHPFLSLSPSDFTVLNTLALNSPKQLSIIKKKPIDKKSTCAELLILISSWFLPFSTAEFIWFFLGDTLSLDIAIRYFFNHLGMTSLALWFFFFFEWWSDIGKQGATFHPLVHSQNACNSWCWVRSQTFHLDSCVAYRDQITRTVTCCLSVYMNRKVELGVEQIPKPRALLLEAGTGGRYQRQHPTCPTHPWAYFS